MSIVCLLKFLFQDLLELMKLHLRCIISVLAVYLNIRINHPPICFCLTLECQHCFCWGLSSCRPRTYRWTQRVWPRAFDAQERFSCQRGTTNGGTRKHLEEWENFGGKPQLHIGEKGLQLFFTGNGWVEIYNTVYVQLRKGRIMFQWGTHFGWINALYFQEWFPCAGGDARFDIASCMLRKIFCADERDV